MIKCKDIPSWFEFVGRSTPSAAISLFKRLSYGSTLEAREAVFWATDGSTCDRGLIALQAYLAGSTGTEIAAAAIDYCHSLDIDFPVVIPVGGEAPVQVRLDIIESLYRTVVARNAGRADHCAIEAVRSGSRDRAILRTYIRSRARDGYFEDVLPLRPSKSEGVLKSLFDRAVQNTQLLRHGFNMPRPANIKPLSDVDRNRALCLLHGSVPLVSNGYAIRTHGMLTGIASHGFRVSAATRIGFPEDRAKVDPRATVEPCDVVDGICYRRLVDPDAAYGRTPIIDYLKKNILAHIPIVNLERPAILHGASSFVNGTTAGFLARKFGLKSVYEVRGLWEITRASRNPEFAASDLFRQFARMEAEACNNADRVICITEALKRELIDRGVDAAKITVVPNGVDSTRFQPRVARKDAADRLGITDTDVVIGYVGSVVDYEGLDDLLWALRILIKEEGLTTARLLVVGDGDALAPLQELARELELCDHVIFTGRVPHDEVEDYYSLMEIMPFPRRPVPVCEMVSPLKPLEAMAMGKCVLASSVAALAEMVVNGHTGLIFEKGNVPSLIVALRRAILDSDLRAQIGMQARAWVERHRSWTSLSARVVELYRDMMEAEDISKSMSAASR